MVDRSLSPHFMLLRRHNGMWLATGFLMPAYDSHTAMHVFSMHGLAGTEYAMVQFLATGKHEHGSINFNNEVLI